MTRKTADVETIRQRCNRMLETPDSTLHLDVYGVNDAGNAVTHTPATPEQAFRMGIAAVLETILHETGNYHGYNHQPGQVTHVGHSPGDPTRIKDDTRRVYH